MPAVQQQVDLLPYNTFHIKAAARYFTVVRSVQDIQEVINTDLFQNEKRVILGGGSNILLRGDFQGLVIKNEIKGYETVREDNDYLTLRLGAGENWHESVVYCVNRNLGGIENLSLIPGTAGAAPMQNIGAYGMEIRETIESVEGVDLSTGQVRTFDNDECRFGYRESIFKQTLKDKYFISSVTLRLTKRNHKLNVSYGTILDELQQRNAEPTIKNISDAVIAIRKSKLPDPAVIGNAGSFFKNPAIPLGQYSSLKQQFPAMPNYPAEQGFMKVPAGWLIEQCGWKGKTINAIGVHKNQALVLVNYGGGHGEEIWDLARKIQDSVREKFGIPLQPEVNLL